MEILQECINKIINITTIDDTSYKGTVQEIDDYMNIHLINVDIYKKEIEFKKEVFIRGTRIKFVVVDPMLKYILQ